MKVVVTATATKQVRASSIVSSDDTSTLTLLIHDAVDDILPRLMIMWGPTEAPPSEVTITVTRKVS